MISSRPIRWAILAAGTALGLSCITAATAGEPSGGGDEQARTSTSGSGGTAAEALRSPSDVRNEMVRFSGDLEPIEGELARRLLGIVCPDALDRDEEGSWHCDRCPAFTSRAGSAEAMALEQMRRGNFLHKKRPEIFATYRGCEARHAAGGGAIVFRKRKKNWTAHYRHPGLNPQQCLVFESDDHPDRLVCRVRSIVEGMVYEHVFDTGGDGNLRRLVRTIDNTAKCPGERFVSSYLAGWERGDENEENQTLVIEKIQRSRPLGEDRESACTLDEAGGEWKRHRKLEIVYRFDGEGLERREIRKEAIPTEGGKPAASTAAAETSESEESEKTDAE